MHIRLAVLCALLAPTTALPVSFNAPKAHAVPIAAGAMAVADFNGDGHPDLAVTDASGGLSILLGDGKGGLQLTAQYPGGYGLAVAVGDFNADGKPDLAVAGESGIAILLGNGDGFFQPPIFFLLSGDLVSSVAVADFDGDGKLDLAATILQGDESFGDTVAIMLGNGDGTFQSGVGYLVGDNPTSVAVGDFNRDGKLDLVVANSFSNNISILLGVGDGTFKHAGRYGAGEQPHSVAVGDFNGDGKLDLAIASNEGLLIYPGNGDGKFGPPASYLSGTSYSVIVADFNGDGRLDLAVANSSGVSILLGKGNGGFAPPRVLGVIASNVVAGDFSGNGKPDLVVADGSTVSVLAGNGHGGFQQPVNYAVGATSVSVIAADFNGDGKPDLAVLTDSGVTILLGNGNGTFQTFASYVGEGSPVSLVMADINGDGTPDLVWTTAFPNTVSVLFGNGDGTFQPAKTTALPNQPIAVAIGGFTRDGIADLAVLFNIPFGNLAILPGRGDGTFGRPIYTSLGHPSGLAAFDFNGDGRLDLVVVDSVSNVAAILFGNGNGTFQPPVNYAVGVSPESVIVADLNNDGKPDLAVANLGCCGDRQLSTVSILLGDGHGAFQTSRTYPVPTGAVSIAVADFNGDGNPDLAVGAGCASILLGYGDGTFQLSPSDFTVAGDAVSVAVGDFNGDGKPDLAVVNNNSNNITLLTNTVP
jgi:hypothetical protein